MSDVTPPKVRELLEKATPGPLSTEYLMGPGNALLTAILAGDLLAGGRVVGSTLQPDDAALFVAAPDIAAAYLRLAAQVARVEALTGGPLSDGYQPYALAIDGDVILVVGLDDLRAALDPEDRP